MKISTEQFVARGAGGQAAELRIDVDVQDVLDRLGMNYEKRRDELFALCPNPGHDDHKLGTWSIKHAPGDDTNGFARCWSCSWTGDIYTLVQLVAGVGFKEAVEFATGGAELEQVDPFAAVDFEEYMKPFGTWRPHEIEMPPVVDVADELPCQKYLAGRGLTMKDIERYGLKDWRQRSRVFIPLTRRGILISWLARTYSGGNPKVLYPTGAAQRWALFGIDNVEFDKPLNLTEGWLDAIRLEQAGLPNPIAVGGNKLTQEKALELSKIKEVVVWMDGDRAGYRMAVDVVAWLGSGRAISVVEMPEDTDPADYTPGEIRNFQPVAWSDYNSQGD
jgi:DNA primase